MVSLQEQSMRGGSPGSQLCPCLCALLPRELRDPEHPWTGGRACARGSSLLSHYILQPYLKSGRVYALLCISRFWKPRTLTASERWAWLVRYPPPGTQMASRPPRWGRFHRGACSLFSLPEHACFYQRRGDWAGPSPATTCVSCLLLSRCPGRLC